LSVLTSHINSNFVQGNNYVYLTKLHSISYPAFQKNVPSASSWYKSCHSSTLDVEPMTPSYTVSHPPKKKKQSSVSDLIYINHTET